MMNRLQINLGSLSPPIRCSNHTYIKVIEKAIARKPPILRCHIVINRIIAAGIPNVIPISSCNPQLFEVANPAYQNDPRMKRDELNIIYFMDFEKNYKATPFKIKKSKGFF